MARQLKLEIEGDARDARKALDDLADEAEKTARSTAVLGSEFRKAAKDSGWLEKNLKDTSNEAVKAGNSIYVLGKRSDKAAVELRAAAQAAAKLDGQLSSTRAELDKLNKSYAESGDPEILKSIEKQYAELDKISRVKKRIQRDDEVALKKAEEAARKLKAQDLLDRRNSRGVLRNTLGDLFGLGAKGISGIAGGAADATSKIPGGKLALGVVGAGAVPAAGALGGAALLAGGGLAGIGAGVAGAIAANPEPFRKSWAAAIADISKQWQRSSAEFEKPTLEAIQILRNAVMDIDLAGPFKEASKYVIPLAAGIGGLVKGIGDGVGILIKGSGPVLGVLAKDLPKIGLAFKQLSKDVAGSADGAGEALHDILDFTGAFVVGVGKGIAFLSDFYKRGNAIFDGIIDANRKLTGIKLFGGADDDVMTYARSLDGAKGSTVDMAEAQKELAEAARKASDQLGRQISDLLQLGAANDNAVVQLRELREAFAENGYVLTGNTTAAIENRNALRDVIQAYEDQRDAAIDAAGGTREAMKTANAELLRQLEELRAILVAHGANTAEVDKYIAKVKAADGLLSTVTIKTRFISVGDVSREGVVSGGDPRRNTGGAYANGGTIGFSGPKLVGERGPEIIWGNRGEFVSTAQQTKQLQTLMSSAGGGGGAAPAINIIAAAPGGGSLEQAIISLFVGGVRDGRIQLKVGGDGRRITVA
ncbi:hypothetical protein ABZS66_37340 [Dactylosporangium sp. NPDC005572]|uniref:hypothetical protein n=1 Tax=Dactylosporangium sp. NPDC005572 TaxID=3156889 RepID=UPI0033B73312